MPIKIFKTHEIEDYLWEEIAREFNRAFKVDKQASDLVAFYKKTSLGYSIHALAFEGERLIGYNALYPFAYTYNSKEEIILGISGGTFVLEEFRKDIFIFSEMFEALRLYCAENGIVATLGVSNENSFRYAIEFLNSKLISYLPYYIMPVRAFNILLSKFRLLNVFSLLIAYSHITLNRALAYILNTSERGSKFELKLTKQFYKERFDGDKYISIYSGNYSFYYRVVVEDGIIAAYLFDFREKEGRTYKSLTKAVGFIMNHHKIDIIIFIGHLRLKQFLMFRVPWKYEPQHLPLTFNSTSEADSTYFEQMSEASNWNFGLMNFDAR